MSGVELEQETKQNVSQSGVLLSGVMDWASIGLNYIVALLAALAEHDNRLDT